MNAIMALIIMGVILLIAVVKNPHVKAIVYGLPIPITAALLASRNGVGETHVIGLVLLVGFLWSVYYLYSRGWHIILADIISAGLYVGIGFALAKSIHLTFGFVVVLSVFAWIAAMLFLRHQQTIEEQNQVSGQKISLWIKALVVFSVAYFLLETKDLLSGIIVTFPFSGVFAVVEMKANLKTLAREFTKNSLAILAFFITVWYLGDSLGIMMAVVVGWGIYFATFQLLKKVKM